MRASKSMEKDETGEGEEAISLRTPQAMYFGFHSKIIYYAEGIDHKKYF